MTWYPDLANACMVGHGDDVRTIGWLSGDKPFPTGSVRAEFIEALVRHLGSPWQPFELMGFHVCDLNGCAPLARGEAVRRRWRGLRGSASKAQSVTGRRNLWIPTPDRVYIAPEMVRHYVCEHGYRPPEEFIDAVLACPDQSSPAYDALIQPFRSSDGDQGLFDRAWAAKSAAVRARGDRWTHRGMCPRCEFWQYLADGDTAEHCGVRLVHLEDREGRPLA